MAFIPFIYDALNKSMAQMPPEAFEWMTAPQTNCPYYRRQQAHSTNCHPFCRRRQTPSTEENIPEGSQNEFEVKLDVHEFCPEEITVKVVDGNVIHVEAKHEERKDGNGSVSRHIVRKYNLPVEFDINKVSSKLSTDGVLCISAPKIDEVSNAREIKVVQTGRSAKEDNNNIDDQIGEKSDGGSVESKE